MENFTPYSSLIGGIILGIASTLLLMAGRIAGISGILSNLIPPQSGDALWRVLFIVGLIAGAVAYPIFGGDMAFLNVNPYQLSDNAHYTLLVIAGLLVGGGTYVGAGCTSGHGICGLGRLSLRSLTAVLIFMAVAVVTVFIMRSVVGG
ncbi:YeeE/YedE family protein [Sneathiella litorea]|uniref:YeeE/YedE family protein n=1 Tax=Sneathiella litorea TaxID=2606216 RepID=A0A6L8W9H9_9PROT|nr:YeeE/YedE thiosulfate transporter family protein [Sneathiella litorea]MZR31122.1 YeeE/YedE family protein [Sneathiella litorea]